MHQKSQVARSILNTDQLFHVVHWWRKHCFGKQNIEENLLSFLYEYPHFVFFYASGAQANFQTIFYVNSPPKGWGPWHWWRRDRNLIFVSFFLDLLVVNGIKEVASASRKKMANCECKNVESSPICGFLETGAHWSLQEQVGTKSLLHGEVFNFFSGIFIILLVLALNERLLNYYFYNLLTFLLFFLLLSLLCTSSFQFQFGSCQVMMTSMFSICFFFKREVLISYNQF